MKYRIFLFFIGYGLLVYSCEDFLEPEQDNRLTREILTGNPAYAEGLLLKAYVDLPTEYDFSEEAATDDAITNNFNLPEWRMANGQWNSDFNPVSEWTKAYQNIFYLNDFLEIVGSVPWDLDSEYELEMHRKRLKGEAYGLRAWYEFQLLRSVSGFSADGELLGYPIVREVLSITSDWKIPRSPFEECVQKIIEDCDSAINLLPAFYQDIPDNFEFNQTMGERFTNRINGNALQALKSRVLLYAASPAFNLANDPEKWEDAAIFTADFLNENGGLAALSGSPDDFWIYPAGGPYDPDIIWASTIYTSNTLEERYYPPSLFGKAEVNPSQNLVDAFPMINGYPITAPEASFIPTFPYRNRDPRLSAYILTDNGMLGFQGPFRTFLGSLPDGINQQTNSTRSGYYMKKFLNPGATIFPISSEAVHFYSYIRFTEVFLNYAEAANEAWGPDEPGTAGFTARQVIAALRSRAGIQAPDPYLASLSGKEELRELIKNERRIELCFEGHRFYDIRRWTDLDKMKSPVNGVFITPGFPAKYEYVQIEERNYSDYMIYGPVPYTEVLKYSELKQNQGW